MEYWKQELYHHGILGMRWGKRNGPPYPLDASDHSASEKKAGWRKSLSDSRIERKKNKIVKRTERQIRSQRRFGNRLQATRGAISRKKELKYATKDFKTDAKKEKYRKSIDDYNEASKYFRQANDYAESVIKNYGDTRIKALTDPSYKKTKEYKDAGYRYVNQKISDASFGKSYTSIIYAANAAGGYDPTYGTSKYGTTPKKSTNKKHATASPGIVR